MAFSPYPIREFAPITVLRESTHTGARLTRARNILLRPKGGFHGPLIYQRFFGTPTMVSLAATLGINPATNRTSAVKISCQGKHALLFYNFAQAKTRGWFYLGDTGTTTQTGNTTASNVNVTGLTTTQTLGVGMRVSGGGIQAGTTIASITSGTSITLSLVATATATVALQFSPPVSLNLLTGSPSYTVLENATLDPDARWYGQRVMEEIFVQNGVDADRVAQLERTKAPGLLRVCGSNAIPATATILQVPTDAVSQQNATWVIDGNSDHSLAFTVVTVGGDYLSAINHRFQDGDVVQVSSSGTLPAPLAPGTNYVVTGVAPHSLRLATTTGTVISYTSGGLGAHTIGTTAEAARAGGVALTFTANTTYWPGAAGHNVRIRILYSSYNSGVDIDRTGIGTETDPFLFTINTGPGASSNDDIVLAVNTSSLTFNIVSASTASPDATADTQSWTGPDALVTAGWPLVGGRDATSSNGFTNTIKSVYLRYWDSGTNNFGYEGPSSNLSAEIVIPEGEFYDVQVKVTGDPSIEGGRFDKIRVYLQFGVGSEAVWALVDELDNLSGIQTRFYGTSVTLGQTMSLDQSRPLPSKYVVFAGQATWRSGIAEFPTRVQISKVAVATELAPEGCNTQGFISVVGNTDEAGKARITAMYSDEYRVQIHTREGITQINPSDVSDRYTLPVLAGALTQSMIQPWAKAKTFYFGADGLLYELNAARYGKREADFRGLDAAAYMRDRISQDELTNNPDRTWMMPDIYGQMLWLFVPATDGTIKGFVYDVAEDGILGEFDFPKAYASFELEADRKEIIIADESGNLLVMDPVNQLDRGDNFGNQGAATPHDPSFTPGAAQNGWGTVIYGDPPAKYTQAHDAQLETGMLDLGDANTFKWFAGLTWRCVAGSRGIVEVTITGQSGNTIVRHYGDMGEKGFQGQHKILFRMRESAVKILFRVIGAEQKAWIIRDLTLLYQPQNAR